MSTAARPPMTMVQATTNGGPSNPDVMKIRLYRNGDENYIGKELIVNRRQLKNFDQLLQMATDHVEMDRAARSLRTPRNGTKVDHIDDIYDKGEYVVVSYGKFNHDIEYTKLKDRYATKVRDNKKISEGKRPKQFTKYDYTPLEPVQKSRIKVPGRIRNTVLDVTPIFVYCNGEDMEPARRIILTRRMMRHWVLIQAEISNYVKPQYSATQYLCTPDGLRVVHKSEIKANEYYVAVGFRAPFKKLNYGQVGYKKPFHVSPRVGPPGWQRNLTVDSGVPYSKPLNSVLSEEESFIDTGSLPPLSTQSEPVTGKRRNRPSRRSFNLVYSDGKEVFPNRAVRPIRHQQALPAISDHEKEDGGSTYRSRDMRSDTRGAGEISESPDRKTENPDGDRRKSRRQEDGESTNRSTSYRSPDRRSVTRGAGEMNGSPDRKSEFEDDRRKSRQVKDDNWVAETNGYAATTQTDQTLTGTRRRRTTTTGQQQQQEGDKTGDNGVQMRRSRSQTPDRRRPAEDRHGMIVDDEAADDAGTAAANEDDERRGMDDGGEPDHRDDDELNKTSTIDAVGEDEMKNDDQEKGDGDDDEERRRHDNEDEQNAGDNAAVDGADEGDRPTDEADQPERVDAEEYEAATKIQAAFRGYQVRRKLGLQNEVIEEYEEVA